VNAATQRAVTPWLVVLCGAGVIALCVLVAGMGRQVSWGDAPPSREAAGAIKPASMPPPVPLASFTEVWQRPLFAADRKPAAQATGESSVNLGDLQLTGIIMTPTLRMALLQDPSGDKAVRVREGAAMPDGRWTLEKLTPRSATFGNGGERKELALVTAAPAMPDKKNDGRGVAGGPPQLQPPATPPVPGSNMMQRVPNAPVAPVSPSTGDESAQRNARIEALKAAVQRRRAEQAAHSANEGVR
jgi:general secretion pathway protein N